MTELVVARPSYLLRCDCPYS